MPKVKLTTTQKILSLSQQYKGWQKERAPKEAYQKYRGLYVAVLNRKIIASGEQPGKVWQQALEIALPENKIPVMEKIPRAKINIF